MEFQILSNGIEIPALGLGTWFIDDDKADKAVISAVKIGYRHRRASSRIQRVFRKRGTRFPEHLLSFCPFIIARDC